MSEWSHDRTFKGEDAQRNAERFARAERSRGYDVQIRKKRDGSVEVWRSQGE